MNTVCKALSASAIVAALSATTPIQAEANPLIVAPAVAALVLGGAIVGGVVVGSAAANSARDGHAATGTVFVEDAPAPAPGCYFTQARVSGVLRQVQVCN